VKRFFIGSTPDSLPPAPALRNLRYGGAEGSFPLGLMASQPDDAPHENRKILAFSTAFILLCGLCWG